MNKSGFAPIIAFYIMAGVLGLASLIPHRVAAKVSSGANSVEFSTVVWLWTDTAYPEWDYSNGVWRVTAAKVSPNGAAMGQGVSAIGGLK